MSTWSGPEQKSFEAVIDGFTAQNPDVDVTYDSAGDALDRSLDGSGGWEPS